MQFEKFTIYVVVHENKASANSAAVGIMLLLLLPLPLLVVLLLLSGPSWFWGGQQRPHCALYIFVMMVTRILTRFIGADCPFNALARPAGEFAATRMPPMSASLPVCVCVRAPACVCVCLLFVNVFGVRFMLIKCNFICHKARAQQSLSVSFHSWRWQQQ